MAAQEAEVMGASQRSKGQRGEREAAALLAPLWPDARRGLTQSRGAEQADVEGTPCWVEIKAGKRPLIRAALAQALRDTDGRPAMVLTKDDSPGGGKPATWRVTMTLQDFARLIEAERYAAAQDAADGIGA
jgi:hypothetical protein